MSFKDWVIVLLIFFCGLFYINYQHYYKKSLTPIVVYNTDSLELYKNKLKEEYVLKNIYVQDLEQLSKQNTVLSNEIEKLKHTPITVTKTEVEVRVDTVYAQSDTIYKNDSIYNLIWHIDEPDGYYHINGLTSVNRDISDFTTQINKFELSTNLTLDIINGDDDKILLIGKTDNPFVNIINMDGVVVDPTESSVLKKFYKQKRWSIGPVVGYGITGDFKLQPYIGIGLSFGIIQF